MKVYLQTSVFDAALNRIRFLFDEFPTVVCGFSGGKDSTVCLELCLRVAAEKNRLPLPVVWIDQEVEWQGTVDFAERTMTRAGVMPFWFQMPIIITNNASSTTEYNHCWKPSERHLWTHDQHPLGITKNVYGTNRFHDLFAAIMEHHWPGKACYVSGMRAEESPKRFMCLTGRPTYKWITWGKVLDKRAQHFTFYPIYDWDWKDVWKSIHDNAWDYNIVYDGLYRFGVPPGYMRVSNLHHETAIRDLMRVQEIEPDTWVKVAERIAGANAIKHIKDAAIKCPDTLPEMFNSWEHYITHLFATLVPDDAKAEQLMKIVFGSSNRSISRYPDEPIHAQYCKAVARCIITADFEGLILQNFVYRPTVHGYRKWMKRKATGQGRVNPAWLENPFIPASAKAELAATLKGQTIE